MSGRNLDATLAAGLPASVVTLAMLAMITFASETKYVWSGVGPLTWNGNTFEGMGSYATTGPIEESTEVSASGTTIGLSGIDTAWLDECIGDIRIGAPVTMWFALMANSNTFIGTPYQLFKGQVDKPAISIGRETSTILLALENKLVNLQRPGYRRYTTNDQHLEFPDDTSMNWVEILNYTDLKWGMS